MLSKEFNKIGDTAYRVGSQITGYINFANFLISKTEENKSSILDVNKLDIEFKKFAKNEQIYNYKKDKVISKRIKFVLKLFIQLNLITNIKKRQEIEVHEDKINKLLSDPVNVFYNLLKENFKWFNDGIEFIKEKKSVNIFWLIITMQIYEFETDDFEYIYESLLKDHKIILNKLVFQLFDVDNISELNNKSLEEFIKKYRKPPKGKETILEVLQMKKENKEFDDSMIYKIIKNTDIFKKLIRYNLGHLPKNKRINYFEEIKKYINSVTYSELFADLSATKIWQNISREYFDLMKRWFDDFLLIEKDKINYESILKIEKGNWWSDIKNNIKDYPYKLNQVNNILLRIYEGDYTFKYDNENLKDITNSTLAEYFVNLHFAITKSIPENDFKQFSRTKLQPGSLLPLIHAPGNGPDMYLLNNEKLTIIETTIHKTVKQIKNNEIFNVLDHVNLDSIEYIPSNLRNEIKKTEIILITSLDNEKELEDVKEDLNYNHQNKNRNYGFERINDVTNFANITKEK